VGAANIEEKSTSSENHFFLLHDSKGFEPGDTQTYDIVREFIFPSIPVTPHQKVRKKSKVHGKK